MNLKTKEQKNIVTKIAKKHIITSFGLTSIHYALTAKSLLFLLFFFFFFWLRKIDFDFEGKLKLVKQPIVPYSTMNSGQENTATSNVWPISWHILFGKHNLYTINAISIDKV